MRKDKQSSEISRIKRYSRTISVVWLLIIIGSLFWNIFNESLHIKKIAKFQAITSINKHKAIRMWASKHGGVYVPMNKRTPANPNLSHIADRNILKPNGETLTLMNPAYMIRQMFDEFPEEYGSHEHIVSLNPLNPNNTPDNWERGALLRIEKGEKEIFEFTQIDGKDYLRLMHPMIAKKSCLKCHGFQGDKVGDIRGGVGVQVDMDNVRQTAEMQEWSIAFMHFTLLLFGFIGIRFSEKRFSKGVLEREEIEGQFRRAVLKSPNPIMIHDEDNKVLQLSSGWTNYSGYTIEDIPTFSAWTERAYGEKSEFTKEYIDELFEINETVDNGELNVNSKKGEIRVWEFSTTPLRVDRNEKKILLSVANDITKRKIAENKLSQQKYFLESSQKIGNIGTWELDIINNILLWTDECYNIFGVPIGTPNITYEVFLECVHPDDREYVNEEWNKAFITKYYDIDHRVLANGKVKWVREKADLEFDEDGNCIKAIGVTQDITKRKLAEAALQESEKLYRVLAENSTDTIWLMKLDGTFLYHSPAVMQLRGYTPEEANKVSMQKTITPQSMKFLNKIFTREDKKPMKERWNKLRFELEMFRKDGSKIWTEVSANAVFDEDGQMVGLQGATYEITKRKEAQNALQESEKNNRLLIENAPYCIHQIDLKGNIISMNPVGLNMMNVSDEKEVIGLPYLDTVCKDDKDRIGKLLEEAKNGKISKFEFKTSNQKVFSSSFIPILDDEGSVVRLMGLTQDITERQKYIDALQEREEWFSQITEQSTEGITVSTLEGEFVFVNPAFCNMIGYTKDELLKMSVFDMKKERGEIAKNGFKKSKSSIEGVIIEVELKRKDKSTFTSEVIGKLIKIGTKELVLGIVLDITDRKKKTQELYEITENLKQAQKLSHVGNWEWDMIKDKTVWSDEMYEIFGVNKDTFDTTSKNVLKTIESEDVYKMERAINDVMQNKKVSPFEFKIRRQSGELRYLYSMSLELGKKESEESNIIFGITQDITDHKKMEEEKLHLEAHLRHQQKLESIGILAGGVAHEINNPINGIMNYAQLIKDKLEMENPLYEYSNEIILETNRVATIVKNLLTFSRDDKETHSPARIDDIVNSTISLIQTIFKHDQIIFNLEVPPTLPELKCRSQQIRQVIMNLLTNAKDSLNEKYSGYDENKILSLSVSQFEKEDRKWIRLTVEDRGKGIEEEIRSKIFDPFFTTKDRATGTGLGLSISYGIVKDHNGELNFESEVGEFTKFYLDLPVDNS